MSRAEADMVTTLGDSPVISPNGFADGNLDSLADEDDEEAQILPSQTARSQPLEHRRVRSVGTFLDSEQDSPWSPHDSPRRPFLNR
ncbi:hypothetical protein WJX77_009613 [Trebouxia sp. C0004]